MAIEPGDPSREPSGHQKESRRLAALARFDFVDPEPGDILNRFARLAAQVFDARFAALCFVDRERVRFLARHGFERAECARRGSFFEQTVGQDDLVWIADAGEIEPARSSDLVTGPPGARFYAGAPLKTPDGLAVGVLCVMDPEPRPLADLANRGALMDLAACAMSEMECWRLNREMESLTARHAEDLRELDLIYERAPVGLTLIDRHLRFRRVNQRLAEMNGKPVEEHVGRALRDVVPDLADTVEPMLRRVFASGEPILDYELIGETPKEPGVERVWMESYYPIPEADGRIGAVAIVVHEVTEERRLKALDRAYVNRLRRVLDGIGSLAGLLDADGRLIEANKKALTIAGLEPEDVVGKPFDQTYWWAHSADIQAELRAALERARGGETVRYDVPVRIAGGRIITIDFQLAPLRDDQGRVINLVPSGFDVTERKAAEAALADSESMFRETFEQSAVGMAHLGLDGQWLRVNDRLCEITGHDRMALLGRTFQDITHPDDVNTDVDNAARLLNGEIDSYAMEKRYVRADGSVRWVNLTVSLRRKPSGEPEHFISVVEDIHPRKQAEERLAVVVSELNHRVKNTLAIIQSVVAHGADEPTPKHEFVRSVTRRIQAMASAHDLLVRSQWRGAAFADLLADVLRPHDLDRFRLDGPLFWLTPNAALGFCLIVHELATNAAKYGALSRDGGRVSIDWRVAKSNGERLLEFSWVERGGPTVSTPSRRGFGSEIIEQFAMREMRGTSSIHFDAEGVRVSLRAPMADIAAATPPDGDPPPGDLRSPPAAKSRGAPITRPLRVLVVEDSVLIAMDLEFILSNAGHTVIGPASTVAEALAHVDGTEADVALLDIDLHGQLVTPVAEKLHDLGIPFAFSTGFEEGGSPLPVYTDAPVLRKPFDEQTVLSTLAVLAASRSS